MIETLCDYENGKLVDDVFDLIYSVVASKHGIKPEDIEEVTIDDNGEEYSTNKEEFQDEINYIYDGLEDILLNYLND